MLMTDRNYTKHRNRIRTLREKWRYRLGLDFWTIHYEYDRGEIADSDGAGNYPVAKCSADWRYLEATMVWSIPRVSTLNDAELEEVFIHECMHILVNEMREEELKHEERVCSTLARAFLATGQPET